MIKRYLQEHILDDLKDKMVFISGPRQVGKTTLAKQIGSSHFAARSVYLNWDNKEDRRFIIEGALPADKELLIFDEIHKYKNWKNYLKGVYDKYKEKFKILVTGSARLDIYKKGGDSLLGRYHSYRLHPLSLGELTEKMRICVPFKELIFQEYKNQKQLFERMFTFGGFPEIFIKQNEKDLRRWHNERADRLVKEDIRDVENVRDISSLQVLVDLLPAKVGSLFSINSLREDLGVTHKTISYWIDIFERFYYHFRIYPFQGSIIKSLRKEPKLYLWDWSEVKDDDAKFENMIASGLLKFCHFIYDIHGYKAQLFYIRDKAQREVDFLVSVDNKPWFCVEAKRTLREVSSSLKYFCSKIKIPFAYQVVRQEGIDELNEGIRVISSSKFLSALI